MRSFRRIVFSFILLLMLTSSGNTAEVSLSRARPVAENWLQHSLSDNRLVNHNSYRIIAEEVITYNNRIVGYNFVLSPVGHIIVPSRDELPVVKLYSFTTSLSMTDDSDIVLWIKNELYKLNLALEAHAAIVASASFMYTRNGRLWSIFGKESALFSQTFTETLPASETLSLGPLLSTSWDQGDPYNRNTPLWYTGNKTVTGCVATAAAQIMKFWHYPPTGQGSTSYTWYNGSINQTLSANFAASIYDWSSMTNTYGGSSTTAQKDAVAKLMSDVGIAFQMAYGRASDGGSGANTMYGTTVYPTYFKYKNTIQAVYRTSYANDSAWMNVFKNEVQNGRPCQLRINDPNAGGHSIVVDGYRDSPSEQIHLNMGWSGSYNGWYVSNQIVTGSYDWSNVNYQAAVIGIEPNILTADISVALSTPSPAPPLLAATPVTQTITVTNQGPDTAASVVMTITLSNWASNGSVSITRTCSVSPPTMTCNLGALSSGISATTFMTITPNSAGTLTHTVSVSTASNDPQSSNNTAMFSGSVVNPVPVVNSLNPSSAAQGGTSFTLTINGGNFVTNSQVQWNGGNRATQFVSSTQLTAQIPAADIASAGTAAVTVLNPAPSGGTSGAANLNISVQTQPVAVGGGGGVGGGCFIATAAFGSPVERHVQILRDFRNRHLINNRIGKAFVDWYYRVSPPLAKVISGNEGLRLVVRGSLLPIVGVAYLIMSWGAIPMLILMLSLPAMFSAVMLTARAKAGHK